MARPLPNHTGLLEQRLCRRTKTLVGLYNSAESGIEMDPELPFTTVCEEHHNLVCHPTRQIARSMLSVPDEWCEECRPAAEAYEKKREGKTRS